MAHLTWTFLGISPILQPQPKDGLVWAHRVSSLLHFYQQSHPAQDLIAEPLTLCQGLTHLVGMAGNYPTP